MGPPPSTGRDGEAHEALGPTEAVAFRCGRNERATFHARAGISSTGIAAQSGRERAPRVICDTTLRQTNPRGEPEGAMCVQRISAQCVLQFTPSIAAGCVLHRPENRVIHRLESCLVCALVWCAPSSATWHLLLLGSTAEPARRARSRPSTTTEPAEERSSLRRPFARAALYRCRAPARRQSGVRARKRLCVYGPVRGYHVVGSARLEWPPPKASHRRKRTCRPRC